MPVTAIDADQWAALLTLLQANNARLDAVGLMLGLLFIAVIVLTLGVGALIMLGVMRNA
jgi:hypothetical protein